MGFVLDVPAKSSEQEADEEFDVELEESMTVGEGHASYTPDDAATFATMVEAFTDGACRLRALGAMQVEYGDFVVRFEKAPVQRKASK